MERLEELQRMWEANMAFLGDRPTKAEIAQAIETVIEFIQGLRLKDFLSGELEQSKGELINHARGAVASELVNIQRTIEEKLSKMGADSETKTSKSLTALKQELANELSLRKSEIEGVSAKTLLRFAEMKKLIDAVSKFLNGDNLINYINKSSKVIDKERVEGLEELEKKVSRLPQGGISGGVVGRDLIKDIDLSDSLNGVTKTFNIQAVWNIVSVSLSSYPYGALRKGVDYTWTPTSITFTSEIAAETQLSSGQKCILTVVSA